MTFPVRRIYDDQTAIAGLDHESQGKGGVPTNALPLAPPLEPFGIIIISDPTGFRLINGIHDKGFINHKPSQDMGQ